MTDTTKCASNMAVDNLKKFVDATYDMLTTHTSHIKTLYDAIREARLEADRVQRDNEQRLDALLDQINKLKGR